MTGAFTASSAGSFVVSPVGSRDIAVDALPPEPPVFLATVVAFPINPYNSYYNDRSPANSTVNQALRDNWDAAIDRWDEYSTYVGDWRNYRFGLLRTPFTRLLDPIPDPPADSHEWYYPDIRPPGSVRWPDPTPHGFFVAGASGRADGFHGTTTVQDLINDLGPPELSLVTHWHFGYTDHYPLSFREAFAEYYEQITHIESHVMQHYDTAWVSWLARHLPHSPP
jgi:hypothetical protein